jgi:hypothetical protein
MALLRVTGSNKNNILEKCTFFFINPSGFMARVLGLLSSEFWHVVVLVDLDILDEAAFQPPFGISFFSSQDVGSAIL